MSKVMFAVTLAEILGRPTTFAYKEVVVHKCGNKCTEVETLAQLKERQRTRARLAIARQVGPSIRSSFEGLQF